MVQYKTSKNLLGIRVFQILMGSRSWKPPQLVRIFLFQQCLEYPTDCTNFILSMHSFTFHKQIYLLSLKMKFGYSKSKLIIQTDIKSNGKIMTNKCVRENACGWTILLRKAALSLRKKIFFWEKRFVVVNNDLVVRKTVMFGFLV